MLANFHTHTTFCDGKGEAEEVVLSAISEGFDSIGFSSHGYTPYDLRYCMKNTEGYIREIRRLKDKYKDKIEIYVGTEEDSRAPVNRDALDYIICSCHYAMKDGVAIPIDSSPDYFKKALALYDGNPIRLAEAYYSHFSEYIKERRPDVIGHFDLLTKYDEIGASDYLKNTEYNMIAEKYTLEALKAGSFFEVNTGMITRGYRTTPCPAENLLWLIYKNGGGVVLSSDSHAPNTLASNFSIAIDILKDVGFKFAYILKGGKWIENYF